jgi:hypothetical protein
MDANQAKTYAVLLAMQKKRETDKEDFMAELDANQEKAEIGHKELLGRLEHDRQADRRDLKEMLEEMMCASHKEMVTEIKPEMEAEMMAYRETKEARLEEEKPTSVDRKSEAAELREVPVEDAEIMPVGEPKKKIRTD